MKFACVLAATVVVVTLAKPHLFSSSSSEERLHTGKPHHEHPHHRHTLRPQTDAPLPTEDVPVSPYLSNGPTGLAPVVTDGLSSEPQEDLAETASVVTVDDSSVSKRAVGEGQPQRSGHHQHHHTREPQIVAPLPTEEIQILTGFPQDPTGFVPAITEGVTADAQKDPTEIALVVTADRNRFPEGSSRIGERYHKHHNNHRTREPQTVGPPLPTEESHDLTGLAEGRTEFSPIVTAGATIEARGDYTEPPPVVTIEGSAEPVEVSDSGAVVTASVVA